MTWIALFLLSFGLADAVGSLRDRPGWLAPAVGGAAWLAGLLTGGLAADAGSWIVFACGVAALLWWRREAPVADRDRSTARRALLAFGVPLALLLAASGLSPSVGGPLRMWLGSSQLPALAGRPAAWVLILLATALFNVSSANLLVRAVLVAVGASPSAAQQTPGPATLRPAQRLRGGRLLGPMERLLILGLTAAGTLEAAALVIAAKGLLRFPELQAVARSDVPLGHKSTTVDEVTEYFLVGSFTSWLIALGSAALVG
ncbi:hypothetical protein [Nigerium massiliense]|uniref:hypothetical protein n=1 Tax=Nigerium massiliense TaxID=1522317 RepID=UPI00059114CE|nr:hypothetical protein [Nigerium massiliense]